MVEDGTTVLEWEVNGSSNPEHCGGDRCIPIGWGAASDGVRTNRLLLEKEHSLHINQLELMTGAFAIKTFAHHQRDIHPHLKLDNKMAV